MILIPLAALSATELGAIATAVATLLGCAGVVRRWKPSNDALYITNAQGSFKIINDLVATLQSEVSRQKHRIADLEGQVAWYRDRYGPPSRREEDVDVPPPQV